MIPSKTYENFPLGIVVFTNSVSIMLYAAGFIIMLKLSPVAALLYLVYIFALEYRLLSMHCVNCWYWGKTCGFGQGRLSAMFFKKGNPEKFCAGNFSWKDLIPDLLVTLIPLFTGVVLLILRFNLVILLALVILVLLTTIGNSTVRGDFACKYCRQREFGCPAEKLFNKETGNQLKNTQDNF